MKKLALGIVGALLVTGTGALVFQHQAEARLRAEIARLRSRNAQISRLEREHQRLASLLVPQAELENLRNDQRELERLRGALAALEAWVKMRSEIRAANEPPRPLAPGMTPLTDLANAGSATPAAAEQTFFWALAQIEPDVMAKQLVLTTDARAKAEALLAALDDDTRAKMSTPEKLMAYYFVGLLGRVSGVQMLGQQAQGPDKAAWTAKLQMTSGRVKDFEFVVRRDADCWREEIPAGMVDHWSNYLLRGINKT